MNLVRWSLPLLAALLSGCVAINPAFSETESGTSAGTTTVVASSGGTETSVGDATAEGTGITGMDSVGVTSTSTASVTTSDADTSDTLGDFDVGVPDCTGTWVELLDDAFLVRCETCSNSNYGFTEQHFVGEGKPMTSVLLLQPPQPDGVVSGADVIVFVEASPFVAAEGFNLSVAAMLPPCDWLPGDEDGMPLPLGESGVTWNDCDANADNPIPWGDDASVLTHSDPAWPQITNLVTADDIKPGIASPVSFTLNRLGDGPPPAALLIASNVIEEGGLTVFAGGSKHPVELSLKIDCTR